MRATLQKYIVLGGMILGFTSLASANTSFSFNFTGQAQSPSTTALTMTSGELTVTETAYWANVNNSGTTVNPGTTKLTQTLMGAYSTYGLGVCDTNESGCNPPDHQIDNYNGLDFISLAFNAAISLHDIKVQNVGGTPNGVGTGYTDVDVSYAWLTQAQEDLLTHNNLAFSALTFSTLSSTNLASMDYNTINGQYGQYLLIGAAVGAQYGGDTHIDSFKLQTVGGTTPEPATFVLIGSGLLAGALIRRRRKT